MTWVLRVSFVLSLLTLFINASSDSYPARAAGRAVQQLPVPTKVQIYPGPTHREMLNNTNASISVSRDSDNVLPVDKRQNQQVPFQWCPEFLKLPPKLCSQCGGDTKVKGTCDQILVSGPQKNCPDANGKDDSCQGFYCKCSENGEDPEDSKKVVTSTVVNGQTGVVTWEPKTFTEYQGLKASTTLTLTETMTSTSDSDIETVVAVMFAGGVAWWAASQAGALGIAALIPPPPQRPDGSKQDDQRCKKDPKEECDNCGGSDDVGLCKSGTEVGCPCDEKKQECPTDGPPLCSSQDCGGDDGDSKCKGDGKVKGCQCCPDKKPVCQTEACKGDKNSKCQADKLKECACRPIQANNPIFESSVPADSDAAITSAALMIFTKVWSADPSKVPGYTPSSTSLNSSATSTPFCTHGAAPHQSRTPSQWCVCGNGTTVSAASGTNACPFNPTSTGQAITSFVDPTQTPIASGNRRVEVYETWLPIIKQIRHGYTIFDMNNKQLGNYPWGADPFSIPPTDGALILDVVPDPANDIDKSVLNMTFLERGPGRVKCYPYWSTANRDGSRSFDLTFDKTDCQNKTDIKNKYAPRYHCDNSQATWTKNNSDSLGYLYANVTCWYWDGPLD